MYNQTLGYIISVLTGSLKFIWKKKLMDKLDFMDNRKMKEENSNVQGAKEWDQKSQDTLFSATLEAVPKPGILDVLLIWE